MIEQETLPQGTPSRSAGMTLSELRFKRATALVNLEVCKSQMMTQATLLRERAQSQGVRGLLHTSPFTLKRLKTADYLFLGMKLSSLAFKLWKRKH